MRRITDRDKEKAILITDRDKDGILPQESRKQLNEWDIKHNPITLATLPAYRKMNMFSLFINKQTT